MSVQTALAEMKTIASDLERQYPGSNRGQSATVAPLAEVIVGDLRPILLALLGGAGLLMLIAYVNVTSLLLARSEGRKREIAVREALGASSWRLIRQFATEGILLVAISSGLGLLSAEWIIQLLIRLIPPEMMAGMPYLHGLNLNFHAFIFGGAISVLAAGLYSVTPIVRLSWSEMRERSGRRQSRFGGDHVAPGRFQSCGGRVGDCHGSGRQALDSLARAFTVCFMEALGFSPIIWPRWKWPRRQSAMERTSRL